MEQSKTNTQKKRIVFFLFKWRHFHNGNSGRIPVSCRTYSLNLGKSISAAGAVSVSVSVSASVSVSVSALTTDAATAAAVVAIYFPTD